MNMQDPKYKQISKSMSSTEQNYLSLFAMRYPVITKPFLRVVVMFDLCICYKNSKYYLETEFSLASWSLKVQYSKTNGYDITSKKLSFFLSLLRHSIIIFEWVQLLNPFKCFILVEIKIVTTQIFVNLEHRYQYIGQYSESYFNIQIL